MTKIEELLKQYKAFQSDVSERKKFLSEKKNQVSKYEKTLSSIELHLSKTEAALSGALAVEIDESRELLSRAEDMLRESDFEGTYTLLTGKTLQEAVRYVLMSKANTYAKGVHALREACEAEGTSVHPTFTRDDGSQIYRPLTFKEDIEAKVDDYETLRNPDGSERTKEERLKLFSRWLDSCTGIANKKKSTKFKVVPVCKELVLIDKNFNQHFLPVYYESVDGVELDSKKGKYNQPLPEEKDFLENAGWREGAENDLTLLKNYHKIVTFEKPGSEYLLGFYAREKTDSDQLRALYVGGLDGGSGAGSDGNLDDNGSFLRVAQ